MKRHTVVLAAPLLALGCAIGCDKENAASAGGKLGGNSD